MRDPAQVAHILFNSFKSLVLPFKNKSAFVMPTFSKT